MIERRRRFCDGFRNRARATWVSGGYSRVSLLRGETMTVSARRSDFCPEKKEKCHGRMKTGDCTSRYLPDKAARRHGARRSRFCVNCKAEFNLLLLEASSPWQLSTNWTVSIRLHSPN